MNRLSLCIALSAIVYIAQAYPTLNTDPVDKNIVLGRSNEDPLIFDGDMAVLEAYIEDLKASRNRTINYESGLGSSREDMVLFEGDMVMSEEDIQDLKTSKNGINDNRRRWPGARLYYQVDGDFSNDQLNTIGWAMYLISSRTCITFRQRRNERNFVSFRHPSNDQGCNSDVGMNPNGGQIINYPDWCLENGPGSPAHELIHALGFFHEQSRSERDDWVYISFENLEDQRYRNNFDKYNTNGFGVGYDYGSVMHYPSDAFGRVVNGRRLETITVRQQGAEIGQRRDLSDADAEKLNRMYCR